MQILDAFSQGLANFTQKFFAPEPMQKTTLPNPEDLRSTTLYEEFADNEDRVGNIALYEEMDEECPEFSDALDSLSGLIIQGDDVQMNGFKTVSEPNSKNKKVKKDSAYGIEYALDATSNKKEATRVEEIIKDFEDRTEIKYKLKYYIRNALKYGDYFGNIIYGEKAKSKQKVIAEIIDIPPDVVLIHMDEFGRLNQEKPYEILATSVSNKEMTFQKHEIFRLQMGGVAEYQYGRSLAFPARKVYQQLKAIETGMVVGRLVRSHQRYLYKIDTTNMAPDVAFEYVKKIKTMMTKRKMTDKNGNLIYVKSPMTAEEDVFLPVKAGGNDGIDIMKSDEFLKNIDDVKYFKDKLSVCFKVQSYGSSDSKGSRNAVAELETKTTQYVTSVQQLIRYSLEKLYNMELKLHGVKAKVMIIMPDISSLTTMRKYDIERLRAEIIKIHKEADVMSPEWLEENIMYLNDEEIATEDTRRATRSAEKLKMLQASKSTSTEPTTNPQGGGSARTTTGFKNKKLKKAGNAYVTPKNLTE